MTPADMIYNFALQYSDIMDAFKAIVALIGFIIFCGSLRHLLTSQDHEKTERVLGWSGVFIGAILMDLVQWMEIWSNTLFLIESGDIYRFEIGSKGNYESQIIFDSAIIFTRMFGWWNLASGTIRFYEAPRYNRPGVRRKALAMIILGAAMSNIPMVIDIGGMTFGYEDAYNKIRNQTTSL